MLFLCFYLLLWFVSNFEFNKRNEKIFLALERHTRYHFMFQKASAILGHKQLFGNHFSSI